MTSNALNFESLKTSGISPEDAREIFAMSEAEFFEKILPLAKTLREHAFANEISFCSIVNAKSGACVESCSFCAQSNTYKGAQAPVYPLMSAEKILEKAKEAESFGATEFSIVTSGRGMSKAKEIDTMVDAITKIRQETQVETCASLGLMSREDLQRLKEAGMINYHHNIETSRSYFPNIVTSHTWEEEVATVTNAKELGFQVCCGGIFGMGESVEQRVEFVFQLKDIDPDSIPINFLNPRPGTPLADKHDLTPLDCLKIIAVLRLAMPRKELFVCGGREVNMKGYQELMFDAGASGTMLGNYLTTEGRSPEQDLALIRKNGLVPVSPHRKTKGASHGTQEAAKETC
ncbi:MAG: biotin synthase BioB [Deltaproteobacteria bacterium]|nr:biotin synthase BioB [Deltaproteobacteria bacterium]